MGKISRAYEKSYSTSNGDGLTAPEKKPSLQNTGQNFLLENDKWEERLRMSTDPHSPWIESFRRLRTHILYPGSGVKPRTVLVTSVAPNEGKGFVCANLGVAIARDVEHQALVIDCDFRRPSLAAFFGLTNETGLVDVLKDSVNPSMLIQKTGQPNLLLLSSGKPPVNPSEILASGRMKSFIKKIAERQDDRIVIFDSPPSIVASETEIMAKYVDGVILVVRHNASKKRDVKKLVESVGPDKIIGVVYNAYPENMLESIIDKTLGYGYDYGGYYKKLPGS